MLDYVPCARGHRSSLWDDDHAPSVSLCGQICLTFAIERSIDRYPIHVRSALSFAPNSLRNPHRIVPLTLRYSPPIPPAMAPNRLRIPSALAHGVNVNGSGYSLCILSRACRSSGVRPTGRDRAARWSPHLVAIAGRGRGGRGRGGPRSRWPRWPSSASSGGARSGADPPRVVPSRRETRETGPLTCGYEGNRVGKPEGNRGKPAGLPARENRAIGPDRGPSGPLRGGAKRCDLRFWVHVIGSGSTRSGAQDLMATPETAGGQLHFRSCPRGRGEARRATRTARAWPWW